MAAPYQTNINGSAGQVSYSAIMTHDAGLKLGHLNGMFKIDRTASGYVAGAGVAISKDEQYKKVFTAQNDRSYPKPSGYALNGRETYGSGKNIVNTTWARDYAVYSGSVTFATPRGRQKTYISQFAT